MAYASKYYDPVKAHEYYEQHKKLKGKTASTASLNETGKKASSYVKSQIDKEKSLEIEAENDKNIVEKEKENRRYSDQVLSETSEAKTKIVSLKKKFSKLNKAQKKILGPKIKRELEKLKSENQLKREKLKNEHEENLSSINKKTSDNKQSISDKYANIYNEEIRKMSSDSSMVKQKTSSNKKKTKTTKKKTSSSKKAKSVEEQIAEKRKQAQELMKAKKKK